MVFRPEPPRFCLCCVDRPLIFFPWSHHFFLPFFHPTQTGNWKLFIPLIPTKTQLQVRQHAYAYFKKRRLDAERVQRKRNHPNSETSSESESEDSDESEDEDEDENNRSSSRPKKKSRTNYNGDSPSTVHPSSESDDSLSGSYSSTPVGFRRKKKKKKAKKKRRAMWTEEEHRLFLAGYKTHPRDWSYLANIVTSKSPTQIRTHAYSVFQRRRRVGTPLPTGFEHMDHSWHRQEDDNNDGEIPTHLKQYHQQGLQIVTDTHRGVYQPMDRATPNIAHRLGNEAHATPKTDDAPVVLRDLDDPHEQLVVQALRERAATWTNVTAKFPPLPPNVGLGLGTTLSDHLAHSIVH